ncbi:cytochrome P450 [Deinococcus altitudinis]|uniref:cytochrome P450 n=1 Tax=Deinococcus altitudinis TaxID=468914 RepID=UPI00389231CC
MQMTERQQIGRQVQIGQAIEALWSGEALRDPYPNYARLHSLGSVLPAPDGSPHVFVTSHAGVSAVLRSGAALSGMLMNNPDAPVTDASALMRPMMLFHNGASHARLRGLMAAAFTPRVVEEQRALVKSLLDELLRPGEQDLVASLAVLLPARVIMRMLGLSGDDETRFLGWSNSVAELIGGANLSPELMARIDQDAREMRGYFQGLADELRAHPQPGLLSALASVEDAGERLSSDELLSNAVLLLAAGHETTSNLIAGGVLALSKQPDAWAALVEAPRQAGVADELLRHVSPVQLDGRTLGAPLELDGQTVAAGQHVHVLLAAANRDPQVFTDPERLDFARPNASRHLAFAAGPHYCLGASLARLEASETFAALAERFPHLTVTDQTPPFRPNFVLRGPAQLNVDLR